MSFFSTTLNDLDGLLKKKLRGRADSNIDSTITKTLQEHIDAVRMEFKLDSILRVLLMKYVQALGVAHRDFSRGEIKMAKAELRVAANYVAGIEKALKDEYKEHRFLK